MTSKIPSGFCSDSPKSFTRTSLKLYLLILTGIPSDFFARFFVKFLCWFSEDFVINCFNVSSSDILLEIRRQISYKKWEFCHIFSINYLKITPIDSPELCLEFLQGLLVRFLRSFVQKFVLRFFENIFEDVTWRSSKRLSWNFSKESSKNANKYSENFSWNFYDDCARISLEGYPSNFSDDSSSTFKYFLEDYLSNSSWVSLRKFRKWNTT